MVFPHGVVGGVVNLTEVCSISANIVLAVSIATYFSCSEYVCDAHNHV
jgi:hypothetical protein